MRKRWLAFGIPCVLVLLVLGLWALKGGPQAVSRGPVIPNPSRSSSGGDGGNPTLPPGSGSGGGAQPAIFAYTNARDPAGVVASLPAEVRGVSWTFHWADIEPSPGVYNWAPIDQALAAATAGGRVSMLRVIAGSFSPGWVQPAVTFFDTPRGPVAPHQVTMPVPWSPQFLHAFTGFVAAYGARYENHPGIYAIQMAGAGVLGEMTIGRWQLAGGGDGWTEPPPKGAGATDEAFVNAWNTIIDAYRAAFPHTPTALDIGDPLGDGKVLPEVLAHARRYGSMVRIQENGLGHVGHKIEDTISAAAGSTAVGWQMWGGNQSPDQLMRAFAVAIQTHATYVEVYLADCAKPENVAALHYLAAGLVARLS